jgi:two-component system response regulator NreC
VFPTQDIHKKIRCVLVHDHVLLRQGLRRLLEDERDLRVVAEAGNTAEALRMIFELRPEVVIAAAHIFECAADQIEQLILRESPNSKVLFLTADHGAEAADNAGCAVRHTTAAELVEMVRSLFASEHTEDAAEWPVEQFVPRNRALTAREREVLKLLAEGKTVRSAADVLGVSMKTVDAHKFNLMRKLGIHNKAELVMWAIQKRVVKLPVNF